MTGNYIPFAITRLFVHVQGRRLGQSLLVESIQNNSKFQSSVNRARLFSACTKTQNNETKPPKQNDW